MKAASKSSAASSGFTLIEIMVSLAVLGILIVALAQVLSIATATTINGRKHMDADSQARMIFDRMGDDLSKMVKRPDVDYIFYKKAAGATGANDAMFFYSESPASLYSDNATANNIYTSTSQSTVSLVGYRVNSTTYQLERLSEALTWSTVTDNSASSSKSNTKPGSIPFVAYSTGGVTPAATSQLDGNWSKTIGTAANSYTDGTDPNYHAIGDVTFRFEISFLLTDGTLSTIPVLGYGVSTTIPSTFPTAIPPGGTAAPRFNQSGAMPDPGATVDPDSTLTGDITTSTYYAVGSRWYNTTTRRGYICTSATKTKAVWAPIGTQDISAIVVGLGILDNNSRKLLTSTILGNMVGSLPDAVNGTPIAQTWGNSSYLTTTGVPLPAAQQIRIYQRYFYLNNQ